MSTSQRSAIGQALADMLGDPDAQAFTGSRILVGWEETPLVLDALSAIGAHITTSSWELITAVGPDGIEVTITTAALVRDGARLLARALLEVDAQLDGDLPNLLVEANMAGTLTRLNVNLDNVPWRAANVPPTQRTLAWALIAIAENHAASLSFGSNVPASPTAEVLAVLLSDAGESVDVLPEMPYDFDDLWLLVLVAARDPDVFARARLLASPPVRLAGSPRPAQPPRAVERSR